MALSLSLAPPVAAAAAGGGSSSPSFLRPAAVAMRRGRSSSARGSVVAMADLLGDFGARDPFPEEIESKFGEKVLGNVDTLHQILIPTLSALSLGSPPAAARRGGCLPGRCAQAAPQGGRVEAAALRRRAAARAAAVRLEGPPRVLRPGAHRQDQRSARRCRPRAGSTGLGGLQPCEGRALNALRRRRQPHRQRLHRRRQD